ncbi:MAG: phenylalanine--tRNA ligase subunit beta, partial [Burkholderiaceae bacterium]|nr:phenylalanine--tRNA ligase subunit beta [Burkholderiaceae bacterium]
QADFFDVKGDVEALLGPRQPVFERAEHPALHPGRSARVVLDGKAVGVLGELHPRWRQTWELPHAPVLFELDLDAVLEHALPQAQSVPRQQPAERDIAVVVKEAVTHAQLMAAVRAASTGGLLREATLFDIYRPRPGGDGAAGMAAGDKSLAVRLVLGSDGETLTDQRIDAAVQSVVERLECDLGARLRG